MTTLLYLQDAYLKEMDATIIDVTQETTTRWQIVLNQTIFYPRGGGQSTDQGVLSTPQWQGKVMQALLKDDRVVHFVEGETPPPVGTTVHATLDWQRRFLHMRLHSAGHVIDFALYLLGLSPKTLVPFKGEHGKKPVIYYQGSTSHDFREELEKKSNELVHKNLRFSYRFVTHAELTKEALYLQPGLPTNKPLRLLTLEGVGSVADGGTHVHTTSDVGHITILPLQIKDGMTEVHYRLT